MDLHPVVKASDDPAPRNIPLFSRRKFSPSCLKWEGPSLSPPDQGSSTPIFRPGDRQIVASGQVKTLLWSERAMVPAGWAKQEPAISPRAVCSQAPRMHLEDGASLGQLPVGVGVHEGVAMADAAGLRTTSMRLLVVEVSGASQRGGRIARR